MKPSERRALEAEKRAQKEAEYREKELQQYNPSDSSQRNNGEHINSDAEYRQIPKGEIKVEGDGYHKESFLGNHVKLITFLICAVLILTVIGPWGIDRLVENIREDVHGTEVDNKLSLSVNGLQTLANMGSDLTWNSLSNLKYVDYGYEKNKVKTHVREYAVEGTDLVLRVGGSEVGNVYEYVIPGTEIVIFRDTDTKLPDKPEYARLISYTTGEYIEDIRTEDISEFVAEHTTGN